MRNSNPHLAALVGLALIVAGFVMVVLSWKGAAATLFVPTQVAYGMSGGLAGLSLVGIGLTVLNVHFKRLTSVNRSRDLDEIVTQTVGLLVALRDRKAGVRAPAPEPSAALAGVSSNGSSAVASRDDHEAWRPPVAVVPGGRSFHLHTCRVLDGRSTQLLRISAVQAQEAGLSACRTCKPLD